MVTSFATCSRPYDERGRHKGTLLVLTAREWHTGGTRRRRTCSLHLRRHVQVEAEEVVRVVPTLHLGEALEACRRVGAADAFLPLGADEPDVSRGRGSGRERLR